MQSAGQAKFMGLLALYFGQLKIKVDVYSCVGCYAGLKVQVNEIQTKLEITGKYKCRSLPDGTQVCPVGPGYYPYQ